MLDSAERELKLPPQVSGMALLEDGRPMVSTRRGQIFILDNAYTADGSGVVVKEFTEGLQEQPNQVYQALVTCEGEMSELQSEHLEAERERWPKSESSSASKTPPRRGSGSSGVPSIK